MAPQVVDQIVGAKVASAIRRTVELRLEGREILSLDVTREDGADEGEFLVIKVVLNDNARTSEIGGARLASLARYIRGDLAEINEHAFPQIRIMKKRDVEFLNRGSY